MTAPFDPEVELHPDTARERGIKQGDWTPDGAARGRARFNVFLDPGVICGQHGWWQECVELNAPGFDPYSDEDANYNYAIGENDPCSAFGIRHRPSQRH